MKSLGQLVIGLFAAVCIGLLVLSGLSLSVLEGGIPVAVVATQPSTPTIVEATPAPGQTLAPTQDGPRVQTQTPTPTQAQPTLCPAPAGWEAYSVQAGDNLNNLAQLTGTSADQIIQGNCLISSSLLPGTILYLPHVEPTRTFTYIAPTAVPCGPPAGWVRYTVQPGDTLFRISQAVGVSVYQLQIANCMSGTNIIAGSRLFVPFIPPTQTPQPPTITPTTEGVTVTVAPPTLTHTPETPAATIAPSNTPVPTNTVEPTKEVPTVAPTVPQPPTSTPELPGYPAPEMAVNTEPVP